MQKGRLDQNLTEVYPEIWRSADRMLHRDQDLPAITYPSGIKVWYQYDKRHRIAGPAVVSQGSHYYWLDGNCLTQTEWAADPRVIAYHSRTQEGAEEWLKQM